MLATLIATLALSTMDQGVLIGLRDQQGGYRTLLVAQRGVAYVVKEHKGDILKSNKQAVLAYRPRGEDVVFQERPFRIGGKFRIGWLANTGLGLEFDESKPGERPFSRLSRRVVRFMNLDEVIDRKLSQVVSESGMAKVKESAERLSGAPSETDWGYVRSNGKWDLVAAVGTGEDRKEITVTGETFAPTPANRGEIAWRDATNEHPDATDLIASRDAPFAVVVTPTYLVVHEASRTGLGRLVRRIPANAETVVHYEFGAAGPLESWHAYIKG